MPITADFFKDVIKKVGDDFLVAFSWNYLRQFFQSELDQLTYSLTKCDKTAVVISK